MREFDLLSKAYRVSWHDEMKAIAWQAWMNQRAKATKKNGKNIVSKWRDFDHFFNETEEFNRLFGNHIETPKKLSLAERNRLINKSKKKGGK